MSDRKRNKLRPQLESLESMTLLSNLPVAPLEVAPLAAKPTPKPLYLTGTVSGTYSGHETQGFPLFKADYTFNATKVNIPGLAKYPKFRMQGNLSVTVNILSQTEVSKGTVTLHDKLGDITLTVTVTKIDIATKGKHVDFTYKFSNGTKAFKNLFDQGTGHLDRQGVSDPVKHTASGTFTVKFTSTHPKKPG